MQQLIVEEMKVKPSIDPVNEIKIRVNFIKATLLKAHCTSLILGISGGVDSTTCGRLAQIAINELNDKYDTKKYQFIAVRLPYGIQKDEDEAQMALSFIQPSHSISINIKEGVDGLHKASHIGLEHTGLLPSDSAKIDFVKGNVKARARMIAQYEVAGYVGGLVLGTDHSAENITGFYTKFGDGACDLAPLFGLNKRQVRKIAETLGAPEQLVKKVPTADLEELAPQKADEDALSVTYDQIDDFLEGKKIDAEAEAKLIKIYQLSQHKRQPIPTIYD
ncbi:MULTISPECIES: ammonia-dependent NAD(+) synthetase [Aliivibrio]|uniref:NH(3)-dependent NAD(+) synthetase n=1 Tax=Aliivibrio finisterrensis TaxID=511998 RepID=A0A4Q5KP83_9GAMM|nr:MULTISPECIES: ammonia-dependent NAD(+) synthetase [Aliivibrio]MDD9180501.1 ammonia-dependent NAD(+) synthetase [Aliivibrio sp. A6]RYU48304.1 ammonia-dependent NAD(+) synthetase [Aliivibrio finisterrensis]RYU49099.1 ammonia-dependent NAD(+) synthetase [Aliivibrio finisterrensis]RYU54335.1 ammonia-dependent NAD(+) synthetase [Aliivibrio finisterrensis]RYU60585.1 ammonia-dependent NAD(+) synthetase [Aliivibrio finisterrensis]